MDRPVVMQGIQYNGTSTNFQFTEQLSSITNNKNIASVIVKYLPPHLLKINVSIGGCLMFSFHANDLAAAHASGRNLLEAVMVDTAPVIIPVADACNMMHDLDFVYDEVAIGIKEEYEMVPETKQLPRFGEMCCFYTGNVDSDFCECDIHQGVPLYYETEDTGAQVRLVTKPVLLTCPTLEFELSEKGKTDEIYEVPYWQRKVFDTDDPAYLARCAAKYRLTPISFASVDLAVSRGKPFEARIVNIMRVSNGFAGRAFSY